MSIRQLTSSEAHVLDHLVDCVMTKGTLVLDAGERETPLLLRAVNILGSFAKVQAYVLSKIERIENKVVEEYDEGPPQDFRPQTRAPFGGEWIDVPDDYITRKYLAESGQTMRGADDDDPSFGRAGVEYLDMKAQRLRRKAMEEKMEPAEAIDPVYNKFSSVYRERLDFAEAVRRKNERN